MEEPRRWSAVTTLCSLTALYACLVGCDIASPTPALAAAKPAETSTPAVTASSPRHHAPATGSAGAVAQPASANADEPTAATPPASPVPPAEPAAPTTSETTGAPASSSDGVCPANMALVEGNFCRHVEQNCLEYEKLKDDIDDKRRCKTFEEPTVCTDPKPRRKMRYCMDKWEYPNRVGEKPMTLVNWEEATKLCKMQGKRLCTESEFTFACEGEQMLPYAYGFKRDKNACNIDRPFLKRRVDMKRGPDCARDKACKAEFERLDGRETIGSRKQCASPFGIYDMNGNVNEWTSMPWKKKGKRASLKGGWWGPVRNRCRALVTNHGETYHGYEVGFRCCSEPLDSKKKRRRRR